MQHEQDETKLELELQAISSKLGTLETKVEELVKTVIGYNGYPGLVTTVALIQSALSNNDKEKGKKGSEEETHITFLWVFDRLVAPIVTATILYFLLKAK